MAYNSTLSSQNIESALKTVHEAITIGGGILSLTSESDSSAISDVVGGTSGFNDLLTKARAKNISFGITVDESSTAGVTMASILADKTESKLTISFAYNRAFIKDVITLSDSTFTLEQTVLPLTGNITYHTHDTTYAAQELETDVWDGTTVSTSWSGSGTKEDPFLIQSCADYIYFLTGSIESMAYNEDILSSTTKYVKITKNLDFGNKAIPTVAINTNEPGVVNNYMRCNVVVDGNGCIIENLSLDLQSNPMDDPTGNMTFPIYYIPYGMYMFIHDVNFIGLNLKFGFDFTDTTSVLMTYNLLANIVLDVTLEITGDYSDVLVFFIVYNYLSSADISFESIDEYRNYIAEKGCFFGINVKPQSIPQNGLYIEMISYDSFTGYDMSNYNFSGDIVNIEGEFTLFTQCVTKPSVKLSTLSTGKHIYTDLTTGETLIVDAETISPEGLNSQDYISEVNAEYPILIKNANYSLPLVSLAQIRNNGYIRQSLFSKYQKKILSLEDYKSEQLRTYRILDMPGTSAPSEEIEAFVDNFESDLKSQGLSYENTLFYILSDGVKPVIVDDIPNELTFTYFREDWCVCTKYKRSGNTWSTTSESYSFVDRYKVLTKDNTISYTPTADYHPATKKYVDDSLSKTDFVSLTVTKLAGDSLKFRGFYENEPVDIELSCTHTEESSESPYIFEHYEVEITESTNFTLFKILSTVSRLYASRYSFPDSPAKSIQTRIKPEVFLDNYYTAYPVEGMLFGIESAHSPGFYAFVGGASSSTGVEIKIIGMTMALNGNKFTLKYFPNVKWNFG